MVTNPIFNCAHNDVFYNTFTTFQTHPTWRYTVSYSFHIAEHNHSERFWRLLISVMANRTEVKSRLGRMAELYLNE